MKKQYNILLGLLLFSGTLAAQVPGYMGKRAYLQIDLNPTPALFNMNMNHTVVKDILDGARAAKVNLLAFNIKPQISFEYLLSQNIAFGINYHQIITGTVRDEEYFNIEDPYALVKGDAAGINLKFYKFKKSGAIAPLGLWGNLAVNMQRVNTFNLQGDIQKQFSNDLQYPVLSWGFGKQFMPFSNLLLSTGAEFGMTLTARNSEEEVFTDEQYRAMEQLNKSMLGYNFFNLKISVGYMLF